jgi:hypothetical protein
MENWFQLLFLMFTKNKPIRSRNVCLMQLDAIRLGKGSKNMLKPWIKCVQIALYLHSNVMSLEDCNMDFSIMLNFPTPNSFWHLYSTLMCKKSRSNFHDLELWKPMGFKIIKLFTNSTTFKAWKMCF